MVKVNREDRISIMQQVSVGVAEAHRLPQLLESPGGGRVGRDVQMQEAARAVVHYHQHVDQAEGCGDRDKKIASDDRLRVIVQERGPALVAARSSRPGLRHVLANGPRRYPQAELEPAAMLAAVPMGGGAADKAAFQLVRV